jgi:hypothetical protein
LHFVSWQGAIDNLSVTIVACKASSDQPLIAAAILMVPSLTDQMQIASSHLGH